MQYHPTMHCYTWRIWCPSLDQSYLEALDMMRLDGVLGLSTRGRSEYIESLGEP